MKHLLLSLFALLSLTSCQEGVLSDISPISIGGKDALTSIQINRLSERHILLSGGSDRYRVNVEDSRIAGVSVHHDTLKVKGLLEGETYASVLSHDQSARLDIRVIAPELTFSTDSVHLYPRQESKFVSLLGGGDWVQLRKDDPNDILSYKWDGNTNIVEINAYFEGTATLIATTMSGEERRLKVSIRPVDEPQKIGIYGTGRMFYSNNQSINCCLLVQRPGRDLIISNVANPDGGYAFTYSGSVLTVSPVVNPKVGEMLTLSVGQTAGPDVGILPGRYPVIVEKVTPTEVTLLGKRHKFVLPYETK